MNTKQTSYGHILTLAWPIMLANSTAPLLGLVDTAVIGHVGSSYDLGAIALGSLIFTFIYWSFGFLRMGTTGFIAQADGAQDETEVRAIMARAGLLAFVIGLLLVLCQWPLSHFALALFGASNLVEQQTQLYFEIRIWGAPASLCMFALMGVLIGLGKSKLLLQTQLVLNILNIFLDSLFAGLLGWGVQGIALGTVMAEYLATAYTVLVVYRLFTTRQAAGGFWQWSLIFSFHKIKQTLSANFDIMLRTLMLLFSFAWFTDQGARFGDVLLGANHILLQFISFSAFFLDGFAFTTESLVGKALGSKNKMAFDHAVYRSSILAALTAVALGLFFLLLGNSFIALLTDIETIQLAAKQYLLWACIYILCSFIAFQLDGIFIGTSATREMRNASIVSGLLFLAMCFVLVPQWQNMGLWIAFIVYVLLRAVGLAWYYPGLRARVLAS